MTLPTYEPRLPPTKNDPTRTRRILLSTALGVSTAMFLLLAIRGRGRSTSADNAVKMESRAAVGVASTISLRSGLEMPAVGFGTCCRPSAKGEAIYKSTKLFLKSGGRLIDTAMAYRNHVEIGRAVTKSGLPRSEIWITSKVAPNQAKNYDDCMYAVDDVLEELDTPYLDLLLIHSPKLGRKPTIELWKCLIESKRLGKTKSIGVSNFNKGEIEDIAEATDGTMPEANQIQIHPWSSRAWKDLAIWQNENGIATIAYNSLGGSRYHRAEGSGSEWPSEVTRIAKRNGATEAQVLLRWALQRGLAVIPGSGRKEHILENLSLPEFRLSEGEMSDIERAEAPGAWWDEKRGPIKYDDEEAARPWEPRKYG
mmetsp:Transcript_347/g.801  ORF Transcript_347/g.801 Transcript_347/m.801 type:complete len:368 (+) Transcript_347:50-1153(+)|eukprot:CAMPEP_0172554636 /NCGR_PEP_ID=MMETSP1067-20121228/55566_1 /TAXON_ID=265564 ORGANISM="Thalassiosira punctigera, Strain Tpunct2005C2" /NCGR_SAMPLE_ID=MMETSP1067 /ASSEMBLY_ACC=CAM_ASM_000444 /LENGTH=367 /DNA_ID=CAMNT_0013343045 /DNA_START=48 /DNA_END=1151 /DNA_ORIENTATION=+